MSILILGVNYLVLVVEGCANKDILRFREVLEY